MSDYSYCIIHKQPPRPTAGVGLWLLSFVAPVKGWTSGSASDFTGTRTARLHWSVRFGAASETSRVGMVHTCRDDSSCRCVTDRQFRGRGGKS